MITRSICKKVVVTEGKWSPTVVTEPERRTELIENHRERIRYFESMSTSFCYSTKHKKMIGERVLPVYCYNGSLTYRLQATGYRLQARVGPARACRLQARQATGTCGPLSPDLQATGTCEPTGYRLRHGPLTYHCIATMDHDLQARVLHLSTDRLQAGATGTCVHLSCLGLLAEWERGSLKRRRLQQQLRPPSTLLCSLYSVPTK